MDNFSTRMNEIARFLSIVFFALLVVQPIFAQDVEGTIESLPEDPLKKFIQPLTNAVGANLNTGWINLAPENKIKGLDIRFGLVGAGAFIDSDEQVFQLIDIFFPLSESSATSVAQSITSNTALQNEIKNGLMSGDIDLKNEITSPTVFGSEDDFLVIRYPEQQVTVQGQTFTVPEQTINLEDVRGVLNDPGIFPTVVPQLSIGTFYGTQATIRWLPNIKINEEVGELAYFGFGIQHNPAALLNAQLPVDLSLSFFTQTLEIGTGILDVTTTAFGLNASKTFGTFAASVTPYAGFLIEKSNMDISYDYEPSPGNTFPISIELEGDNKSRFVLGLGLNLFGVNIFTDYNFSDTNTFNATLMYGF